MKIGVCLAGSGVFDGTEIHEAVLTILELDKAGVDIVFMAPNIEQTKVMDHSTAKFVNEKRNVMSESARITRGSINDITDVVAKDIDALIFPGGFGAALNLCDFATKGAECEINSDVERLIHEMIDAKKPIGAMCIAPAMLAKALASKVSGVKLTIGSDKSTANEIEKFGSIHVDCNVNDIIVDEEYKIVTTPAYMLGKSISEIALGINKLVNKVKEMA
jgi:enhancing lycopene biosynthesis protein 2